MLNDRPSRPPKWPSDSSQEPSPKASAAPDLPASDATRLLHELQVHQAELAQQNEELKAARDDLEASAQRFFDLYESAPVGLVTLTRRGIAREVNRHGRELLGIEGNEPGGGCLLDRLAEPGRTALAGALSTAGLGSNSRSVEIAIRTHATEERILRAEVRLHPAGGDSMLLALTDITEQRRSEADLAHTREVLELSNRMARIGYWRVDLDTGAATWSAVAREIYGLSRGHEPTLEQAVDFCKNDEGRERLRRAQAAAVERGETFDLELKITTATGVDRWIRITGISDAVGSPGRRLYGTVQDIDAQVEAQHARVAQASAEMANRSKTAFLARMSHDLRTPLNAVLGFSELLQLNRAAMSLPDVPMQVRHIHHAGKHLLAMIDEVLDLTRIESGDIPITMEPVPLGPLFDDCMSVIAPLAAARAITWHAPSRGDGQSVLGDPTRLRQVAMNLLSNAVKYNRDGGSIEIDWRSDADRVAIAVRDTGYGLTPEQVGQLFQPFNRLGAELRGIDGTGLGLVIAKQLVEAMGGSLEARSAPDEGSVFTLRLQRAEGAEANPAPEPTAVRAREAGPGARPFVVLYVEDNPVNVELMRAALALRGQVQVEVATDGQAGLEMARALRPDLVLMDMGLPIMDGLTVLRRLQADPVTARVPCVAVSANALDADIRQALDAGFKDYIVKPFVLHRLLALLDDMIAARLPSSP